MDCRLVVVLGGVEGDTYSLHEGATTVGRDTDNDIQLISERVSRHHARFQNLSAVCRIEDLDSTNGTFINGKRISSANPYDLKQGDQISIGELVLRFDESSAWGEDGRTTGGHREYSERSQQATVMVERRFDFGNALAKPKETVSPFRLKSKIPPSSGENKETEMSPEKAKTQPLDLGGILRFKSTAPDDNQK